MRRILRSPITTLLLGLLFVYEVRSLSAISPVGRVTGRANARTITTPMTYYDLVRTPGGRVLVTWPGQAENLPRIGRTELYREISRSGFWAITREKMECGLRTKTSPPLSSAEQRVVLDTICADRTGWNGKVRDALMRSGSCTDTRILWGGYLHNLGTIIVVVLLAYSLGWIVDLTRSVHGRYAVDDGRCRACRYDLRGSPGGQCSECGHEIERPVSAKWSDDRNR